ncbi:hypothetical protein Csa_006964 [Cucumis sativus]|uniref:Uncharacterized protein n=1 Tax=Cucumis sativus TaxID=3659 RepID=A0A0A0LWY8_CUCSA|nr:hypothetical protein Csa_006964 [Cucumis sativus]
MRERERFQKPVTIYHPIFAFGSLPSLFVVWSSLSSAAPRSGKGLEVLLNL